MKLIFSLRVAFYFTKTEKRSKNSLTELSKYAWSKGIIFAKKMNFFSKRNADISKIKRALVLKGIFLKLCTCVYLRTKCQVFSITPTSFS